MKKVLTIAAGIFFMGCASWQAHEKMLAGTYVASQVIDTAQTVTILDNPDKYSEVNPFINSKGSLFFVKVGATAAVLYIADMVPEYRAHILTIANAIGWGVVIHNHSMGVRVDF